MNNQNINTPPQMIEMPEGLFPEKTTDEPSASAEPTAMIEMPEHIKAGLPDATTRGLGATAEVAGGLYGNGVIPVDKGPGIPIENPGPQSINQAVANGSLPAEYVRR